MDIDFGTAVQLVAALKARKLSATELLKHTIARIELFDRSLNAVVVRDFDHAFEAAAAADAALARGDDGSLLGIPVTFKEAFNIGGLPTTWGFARFQGFVAKEDALAVVRAKRAGAVVLGKTNVPPGLGDFQSYNTTSTGSLITLGTRGARQAVPRADRPRRSPPGSVPCRSDRISADR